MNGEAFKITVAAGKIGLVVGDTAHRTYWMEPVEAMDLADQLHDVAEEVGAQDYEQFLKDRKQSA